MNLILSNASDAFEITYLKNIYFCVYNELIKISINLFYINHIIYLVTYVVNSNVSGIVYFVVIVFKRIKQVKNIEKSCLFINISTFLFI
jgi:hypothetical protein